MSIPILTFFNNKGGVGKTSLVYHLAWMFASLRKRVLLADLDPQANLTAALLNEAKIEDLWESQSLSSTIYRCVKPLTGVGDIIEPTLQKIADDLYLIPGDVSLSSYEDTLSTEWPNSMGDNNLYRNAFMGASTSAAVKGYGSGVVDLSLLIIGTNKNNRFIGSLSNDRDEEYRLAGYVEELDRFLNKVSNGNVTVDDL